MNARHIEILHMPLLGTLKRQDVWAGRALCDLLDDGCLHSDGDRNIQQVKVECKMVEDVMLL